MVEIIKNIWDFLANNLGFRGVALLLICCSAVYIWYQHLRNRLLREQIDLEKARKEEFLNRMVSHAPTQEPHMKLQLSEKAQRVLIVDDEKVMLEVLQEFLKVTNENVEVETAVDGKDALEKIEINKPSILVTDIVMPEMSGIDLLQELKNRNIDLPVLLISGYSNSTFLKNKGIRIGEGVLFLQKPIRLKEFIATLNHLVEKEKVSNKSMLVPR